MIRVCPYFAWPESCLLGEGLESFDRVFIRIFRMYRFTRCEAEAVVSHADLLLAFTYQMHFDALSLLIVKGLMRETVKVEVGTQFPVDMDEQVEVELGGNAVLIVVRCIQNIRVFFLNAAVKQGRR